MRCARHKICNTKTYVTHPNSPPATFLAQNWYLRIMCPRLWYCHPAFGPELDHVSLERRRCHCDLQRVDNGFTVAYNYDEGMSVKSGYFIIFAY
jgi:hypothetical protein